MEVLEQVCGMTIEQVNYVNCGGAYRDCIKRNGDKTWVQSAH